VPLPAPAAGAVEGIVVISSEPMPSAAERNSSRLRRTGRQAQPLAVPLTAPTMPSVATQNRMLGSRIRPVTGVRYARTYSHTVTGIGLHPDAQVLAPCGGRRATSAWTSSCISLPGTSGSGSHSSVLTFEQNTPGCGSITTLLPASAGELDYRAETLGPPATTPRRRPPARYPAGPNQRDRRTSDRRTDHAQ
jgi:hypothetical protein